MVSRHRAFIVSMSMLFYCNSISGCAQLENTDNTTAGKTIGAVACGTAGLWLSRNANKLSKGLITAGSAIGCGWLGGQIGAYLDEKDREKMNEAAQAALDTGEVQTWGDTESDTSGTAQIVPTAAAVPNRSECQTVRNTIVLANGSEKQEDVTACKGANGQWEVAEG